MSGWKLPPEKFSGWRRTAIADAWAAELPGLGRMTRAGHPYFLRIAFPLLQGVILEGVLESREYRPRSFAHLLSSGFGTRHGAFALNLESFARRPNGSTITLAVRKHPVGAVEAAALLREQSPLPLDRELTVPAVLEAVRRAIAEVPPIGPHMTYPLYEILILLPATCGLTDLALDGIERAARLDIGDLAWKFPHGDGWLDDLRQRASDPEALRATAEHESEVLGLGGLPRMSLCSEV